MAAEVDTSAVSAFCSLPETSVSLLLDEPTSELVKTLLQNISVKAKEYDQFTSQKIRLEVQLEQSVRTSESKLKIFKNASEKALADVSKLRVALQQSENATLKLESELGHVRSSVTQDASENATLKSRVSSLESSNRDTVVLLESKTSAYEKIGQDLAAQHQKAVDLRKQIASLEQTLQASNSANASARFREQSLIQERDSAQKNSDYYEGELKQKQAEHIKFRKEKGARISELTRANEQYIAEADALRRTESLLKSRLAEEFQKHEDSLQEIQQLREEKASDAEAFRIELESAGRLAELQKASADTAKERAQELSMTLDEAREEAANEIGKARAEAVTEHNDKLAAEQRIAELESAVDQLETELAQARALPATPHRGPSGTGISTPLRPSTPTGMFSPASAPRLKGNLSMTQLYSSYKELERNLAIEKRNTEQLQSNLDSMLQDLESTRPEVEELRAENGRLQSDILEMSTLVEKLNRSQDESARSARVYQGQAESRTQEMVLIKQQLDDTKAQVKVLVMEQHIRESGQELGEEQIAELKRVAKSRDMSEMNLTGRVISENLTTFKTVAELQEQNTKILNMLRTLGDRMESDEVRDRERSHARLAEDLEAKQAQIVQLQAELKSMKAQLKTFSKERGMFQGMLTRRGPLPPHVDPTDFSRSLPLPAGGSPARGQEGSIQGSVNGTESDYAKLFKDMQAHFETFRQESTSDNTTLRSQVGELARKNSQLQTEATKTLSQLSAANQRSDMLQANYSMLQAQNLETQRRSEAAIESAARQETRTQQVAEELVETRGLLDGARREAANIKAEKDLWKNVEKRLIDDNESLRNERGRLDQLTASLQSILNEREQSDSETRRRLQSQVDSLEAELQTAKRKLDEEREQNKNANLRREYEHEQNQKRIDDLVISLSNTREDLASTKTARDHLQARVDELIVEIRSVEERLAVLNQPPSQSAAEGNNSDENTLSREQELAIEVSELTRDLELKASELARANEQMDVYKTISQSSEDRLQELSDTNDQYHEETDAAMAEKDKTIKDLEQRVQDISSELITTNNELSLLSDEHSEARRKLEEQKAGFETEIARLKEQEERSAEQAQFNLEASKAQAQIATEAQQNYENELVKHAEAAKNVHTIRAESNQIRLELVEYKTQVETAQTSLAQKEASWAELRDRYERELTDVKTRREEVLQQNKVLHGQLDTITKQISSLQQNRTENADGSIPENPDVAREGMQELITYLRREKDIVEVQFNLSSQGAKRLQQELDFVRSQLDETRLRLDQQRRAEVESERNNLSHNKLMETLNELNLFRESSVTLRAESKQATLALAEAKSRVETLERTIEPLKNRVSELDNLLALREGEMKLLQDDRDHWQQRTQNILSKYDRVDPAELESLKEKLASLEMEREDAVTARADLQTQVDGFPEQLEASRQELRARLGEQFKARSKEQSGKIREKQNEVDAAVAERNNIQAELEATKVQLDEASASAAKADPKLNGSQENGLEQEPGEAQDIPDLSARVKELEAQVAELQISLNLKQQELSTLTSDHDTKSKARETQLKEILNKRLAEVKTEAQTARSEALKELEDAMRAQHQQELEDLRAKSVPVAPELQTPNERATTLESPAQVLSADVLPTNLTEEQARQVIQKNDAVRKILTSNIRKRVEEKEALLRKEFEAASAEKPLAASDDKLAELEQKFTTEKEALIKEKEDQLVADRQHLVKEYEDKIASEKQSLIIKHQEQLASERLEFSKESEKKIADQLNLAEKRTAVKLSMAENRARQTGAKLEVVKRAAEETPQKPVGEVWEVAKNTKAPPATAAQQKPTSGPPAPVTSAAVTQSSPANTSAASPAKPVAITPDTTSQLLQPSSSNVSNSTSPDGPLKISTPANATSGPATLRQLQSGLPRIPSSRGGGRAGSQALNQVQQTIGENQQLPGGPGRGSGIPRGQRGGRAGGRAGTQNVQTNIPSTSGRPSAVSGSPRGGGSLNPAAQQFTPQINNKRAREDSEGGDTGNQGKRIRGASGEVPASS